MPSNLLLTCSQASETPIGKALVEKEKEIKIKDLNDTLNIVGLMQERRKLGSNYAKWFAILPTDYSNFPLFFTKE